MVIEEVSTGPLTKGPSPTAGVKVGLGPTPIGDNSPEGVGALGATNLPPWKANLPPDLRDALPTALEQSMTDLVNGPDQSWMEDAHAGQGRPRPIGPPTDDEETRRAKLMATFEADPALVSYRVPGLLGVYLRNRWLHEQLNPTAPKSLADLLDLYLEEAVDHAGPELATAAAQALADLPDPLSRHAGDAGYLDERDPRQRVVVGPVHWPSPDRDGLVGIGQVEWAGEVWGTRDYQASLALSAELQSVVANAPEDPSKPHLEDRQCLLLHVAAGLLWSARGHEPSPTAVQSLALELRQEMYEQACVASAALGPSPPAMGQSEADLRTFIHDLVHRDHDKDYRSLAAFPPKAAEHLACHILRVSHRGVCLGETVYGWDFDASASPHVWLLVHRGHMRLLIPPGRQGGADLHRAPALELGFAQIYAAGWEAHLLAGIGDPPTVLAKSLEACPRCPSSGLDFQSWRTGMETHAFGRAPLPELKIGAEPVRAVETHDLENPTISTAELRDWLRGIPTGSDQTTTLDACLTQGCDFLEVWGGAGRTTQAVTHRGGRALVIGLAWGHDLGEARQRAYLYALMKRVRPRYVWLAFPCTAFCCWVRLNRSQGCDLAARQREGKRHLRTTLQAAQLQRSLGGHVALENPLTSLAWRDPAVAAELAQPPWLSVRLDQCSVGLTGPGGGLHLKPTAIRTTCPAMAQAMNLRCSGDHAHETVEGKATSLSAMYSPQLARRIANVVVPTKIPGGGSKFQSPDTREPPPKKKQRQRTTWNSFWPTNGKKGG